MVVFFMKKHFRLFVCFLFLLILNQTYYLSAFLSEDDCRNRCASSDCKTDSKMVETALYRKKGVKSVKTIDDAITIVYDPNKVKPEELKSIIENTGTCEDPNAKVHKVKIKTP